MNTSIRNFRRLAPILFGILALMAGFAVLQFALASRTEATSNPLARGAEATATRGALRTPTGSISANAPSLTTTSVAEQATTTTALPTTTEAVPTTAKVEPTTVMPTTAAPATVVRSTVIATTTTAASATASANVQSGKASYYDHKPGGCAHKTLPKGTLVTVTNLGNGKSTTCVVNDRGPFIAGRIIDLETRVFTQVSTTSAGVFNARISW